MSVQIATPIRAPRRTVRWVQTSFQNISIRVSESVTTFTDRIRNYFHPPPPAFDEEEIEEFMELTYLTKEEILKAYKHFCNQLPQYFDGEKNPYLPRYKVMGMPEFNVNPFREQLMDAVSTYEDFLTFEDFLEMMSVFSKRAPIELKAEYLFRIYDFDFDDIISMGDLVKVIKYLVDFDQELEEDELYEVAVKVLLDGDLDGDGILAFSEFVHLMQRLDDFKSSFTIRI